MSKRGLKYRVFKYLADNNIIVDDLTNRFVYKNYLQDAFHKENPDTVKRAITEYRAYLTSTGNRIMAKGKDSWNVLFIPDLHAPFIHKDALAFCVQTYNEYDIDEVVFAGDIIDNHFSSFHDSDPDGMAAGKEIREARRQLRAWKHAFPNATVTIGNHDAIPTRKAFNAGLSNKWIKSIDEIYDLKGWKFVNNYTLGRNFFTHGMGMNAIARARALGLNTFQGHLHSKFECTLVSVYPEPTFAVYGGCLVDHNAYAFAYGKDGKPQVRGVVVIKDALKHPEIIMKPMY